MQSVRSLARDLGAYRAWPRALLVPAWLAVHAAPAAGQPQPPGEAEAEVGAGTVALGGYGRVTIGTDLRGGTPEQVGVVSHPPRIIEPSYAEFDLVYRQAMLHQIHVATVATLAFGDELFHYTGEFEAALALRNLYVEARRGELSLWIGSRMYRGDDIYLLDFWPLADYNTVGGGGSWARGRFDLRAHAGAHRLRDEFQFQEIEVPAPEFGSETIEQLDRQRWIASVSPGYQLLPWLTLRAHLDGQALGSGTFRREDDSLEELPSDFGWTVGAQLSARGWDHSESFAHLFARAAGGLAAFDELAVPHGLDADKRAFPGASELVLGLSGADRRGPAALAIGAYARRFVDADGNRDDRDDGWEYAIDLRPTVHWRDVVQAGVDLSYQRRLPRGASPTALELLNPAVFQVAPMIALSPRGASLSARPHFRLLYRAAHLNRGARDTYPLEDPRRNRTWVHFLGLQAEWWFNSTTYP